MKGKPGGVLADSVPPEAGAAPTPSPRKPAAPPARRGEEARKADIDLAIIAIGETWAVRCQRDLRAQGREVAGGWPGTMTEARAVTLAYFASPAGHPLTPLSREELEHVARAANAHARGVWRSVAVSDESEPT